MEFLGFLILVAVIVIWYLLAEEFYRIAKLKGYTERKYFWYAFLFNFAGYLLVMALPNKNAITDANAKMAPLDDLPSL